MSEEEVRKLVLEERRLYGEIEQISREIALLEKTMDEINGAIITLKEIQGKKPFKQSNLFPVGGGVLIFGRLTEEDRVLVNVGANVYISKTMGEAVESLSKSYNFLMNAHVSRVKMLNDLKSRHNEIVARILEHQTSKEGGKVV